MPGIGSAWMKLRTNSSASGPEVLLSFSMTASLEPSLKIQLLPIQFRRREAEAGDAVDLGEERRQAPFDAARRDEGIEAWSPPRCARRARGRSAALRNGAFGACAISSSRAGQHAR